jgi:hypothetical protein
VSYVKHFHSPLLILSYYSLIEMNIVKLIIINSIY